MQSDAKEAEQGGGLVLARGKLVDLMVKRTANMQSETKEDAQGVVLVLARGKGVWRRQDNDSQGEDIASISAFRPVILVCGKTGAGKTSLIRTVTGGDVVPLSAVGESGRPETRGFKVYETPAAIFVDAEGMEPGRESIDEYRSFLTGELVKRLSVDDVHSVVSAVWYCVDGSGGRFQEADAQIASAFGAMACLVVTKCEIMRKKDHEAFRELLGSMFAEDRVIMVSSDRGTGLSQLISKTHDIALRNSPETQKSAFESEWESYFGKKLSDWMLKCDEEADSCIRWGAGRSFAIALPCALPLSDMIPLSINEAYMIMRIGSIYGESVGTNIIGMITGIAAGSVAGKFLATMMPPGLKSVIAASVTYGLGKAAKAYFRSGKTLSKEKLRQEFLKFKAEGKTQKWENNKGIDRSSLLELIRPFGSGGDTRQTL